MKTAYFDAGLRYDDPNLRWGSPAYLLEPGDPGYVPPLLSGSETSTKNKRMKHNNYYPLRQAGQIIWLVNFMNKLANHATVLGLTTAQVTATTADCGWLIYVLQTWLNAVRAWALSCTDASNATQTGAGGTPVFTAPALPTGVTPTTLGALIRLFILIAQIKASGKLTDDIATDLQIVGSVATGPDLSTVQPVISAKVSGAQVELKWGWQGNSAYLSSCKIVVDRGAGFVPLTIDTTPNYTDTLAHPTAKTIWTCKAIYRRNQFASVRR